MYKRFDFSQFCKECIVAFRSNWGLREKTSADFKSDVEKLTLIIVTATEESARDDSRADDLFKAMTLAIDNFKLKWAPKDV